MGSVMSWRKNNVKLFKDGIIESERPTSQRAPPKRQAYRYISASTSVELTSNHTTCTLCRDDWDFCCKREKRRNKP